MDLLASIWIEEAQNAEALFGFEAARLIFDDHFLFPDVTFAVLEHIISRSGGTYAAVELLFQRIHRNLNQAAPCFGSFSCDVQFIIDQLLGKGATSSIMRKVLLSFGDTVPHLVKTLNALLNPPP